MPFVASTFGDFGAADAADLGSCTEVRFQWRTHAAAHGVEVDLNFLRAMEELAGLITAITFSFKDIICAVSEEDAERRWRVVRTQADTFTLETLCNVSNMIVSLYLP